MAASELFHISLQMLGTQVMINAVITPFETRPKRLQTIDVCLIANILAYAVADRLMLKG